MLKSRLECSIIPSNWITPKEKISRILIGSINNHYPKDKFHSFSNYCKPEAIERCYPEEITLNKEKKKNIKERQLRADTDDLLCAQSY